MAQVQRSLEILRHRPLFGVDGFGIDGLGVAELD